MRNVNWQKCAFSMYLIWKKRFGEVQMTCDFATREMKREMLFASARSNGPMAQHENVLGGLILKGSWYWKKKRRDSVVG